jgi:hypothetical protein
VAAARSQNRYRFALLSINAFIVNPDGRCFGPTLMGLTGLHILRLTPATPKTWFWSTFEQGDNLTVPSIPRPDGQPLTPSFGNGKTFTAGYNYQPRKVTSGRYRRNRQWMSCV